MPYTAVSSSDVLWDGPLFADEVGWKSGITSTIRDIFNLESLRVIPAKQAMTGVVTIYFRPQHREWALVRYAKRYRWIFETLLGQGMSGERRLLDNDFRPEDIDFLNDIIPSPDASISPAVYDILWRSKPFPAHFRVAKAIDEVTNRHHSFTPQEIISHSTEIEEGDTFVFDRLIRAHLIEKRGAGGSFNATRNRKSNQIAVDLEAEYVLTAEGKEAVPTIVSEYERIFVREEFEPLQITPEHDPDGHIPTSEKERSSNAQPSGGSGQSPDATDDLDVLSEIERELASLTGETSSDSETQNASETQPSPNTENDHVDPEDDLVETQSGDSETPYASHSTDEDQQSTASAADTGGLGDSEDESGPRPTGPTGEEAGTSGTQSSRGDYGSTDGLSESSAATEEGSDTEGPDTPHERIAALEATVAQLKSRVISLEAQLEGENTIEETGGTPPETSPEAVKSTPQTQDHVEADEGNPSSDTMDNGEGSLSNNEGTCQSDSTDQGGVDRELVREVLLTHLRKHRSASRNQLRLHIWKELPDTRKSPRGVWEAADVDGIIEQITEIESERGNYFTITDPDPAALFDFDPEANRSRSQVLRSVYYWIRDQGPVTKAELETFATDLELPTYDSAEELSEYLFEDLASFPAFVVQNGQIAVRDSDSTSSNASR